MASVMYSPSGPQACMAAFMPPNIPCRASGVEPAVFLLTVLGILILLSW